MPCAMQKHKGGVVHSDDVGDSQIVHDRGVTRVTMNTTKKARHGNRRPLLDIPNQTHTINEVQQIIARPIDTHLRGQQIILTFVSCRSRKRYSTSDLDHPLVGFVDLLNWDYFDITIDVVVDPFSV